jgi:hypothetical protein
MAKVGLQGWYSSAHLCHSLLLAVGLSLAAARGSMPRAALSLYRQDSESCQGEWRHAALGHCGLLVQDPGRVESRRMECACSVEATEPTCRVHSFWVIQARRASHMDIHIKPRWHTVVAQPAWRSLPSTVTARHGAEHTPVSAELCRLGGGASSHLRGCCALLTRRWGCPRRRGH